jgi:hypothetical protein
MEHKHIRKYLNFCWTVLPEMLITTHLDSFTPNERNVFLTNTMGIPYIKKKFCAVCGTHRFQYCLHKSITRHCSGVIPMAWWQGTNLMWHFVNWGYSLYIMFSFHILRPFSSHVLFNKWSLSAVNETYGYNLFLPNSLYLQNLRPIVFRW